MLIASYESSDDTNGVIPVSDALVFNYLVRNGHFQIALEILKIRGWISENDALVHAYLVKKGLYKTARGLLEIWKREKLLFLYGIELEIVARRYYYFRNPRKPCPRAREWSFITLVHTLLKRRSKNPRLFWRLNRTAIDSIRDRLLQYVEE